MFYEDVMYEAGVERECRSCGCLVGSVGQELSGFFFESEGEICRGLFQKMCLWGKPFAGVGIRRLCVKMGQMEPIKMKR